MFQLGQFDLQLALVTASTLRENIENETAAIQDSAARQLLKVAFLTGGECVIHQDHLGAPLFSARFQLLGLTTADVVARIGRRARPSHDTHGNSAR